MPHVFKSIAPVHRMFRQENHDFSQPLSFDEIEKSMRAANALFRHKRLHDH